MDKLTLRASGTFQIDNWRAEIAEPAETQLELLLKVERLFNKAVTEEKAGYSDHIYLCHLLSGISSNIEAGFLMRMLRKSCSGEENSCFLSVPFSIYEKTNDCFSFLVPKINLHRAIWLDFMILVLADEAGVELVEEQEEVESCEHESLQEVSS